MRIAVLLTLSALVLAGCTGIPEGAAGPLDQVSAGVTVTDADTGEVLLSGQSLQFQVGSGDSGLGLEFERALLGRSPGESFTVHVRDDASLSYQEVVERSAILNTLPMQDEIDNVTWANAFGTEPKPGDRAPWSGTPYELVVVSVEDGTVTYRVDAQEDATQEASSLAATILFHVLDEDTLQIEILPHEGESFEVQANPFTGQTFQDLEPGSYRHLGRDGDTVRYASSGNANPAVVGHALDIEVTLLSVQDQEVPTEPVDGNYGVRYSPVVNGAVDPEPHYGAMGDTEDGHSH